MEIFQVSGPRQPPATEPTRPVDREVPPPTQAAKEPPGAPIGRPRDPYISARVISATQQLLSTRGLPLPVDAIAAASGVGKATIYRRWPTASELISDAVRAVDPLPPAPSTASTARDQLLAVLHPLGRPLTSAERTVAAALAQASWDARMHLVGEQVLLAPLRDRVRSACRAHPGPAPSTREVDAVVSTVEGLWVRRLVLDPPALCPAEIDSVVDDLLSTLTRSTET